MPRLPGAPRDELESLIARGAVTAFVIQVSGVGLTYLAHILVARWLGPPAEYGIFSYGLAWANLLSVLAALGFPVVALRFIPIYRSRQDWALLRGAVRGFQVAVLVSSAAIPVLATLLHLTIGPFRDSPMYAGALVGLWIVPVLAAVNLQTEIARSFGYIRIAYLPKLLRPALLILGAFAVGKATSLSGVTALLVAGVGTLLSWTVQRGVLTRALPAEARRGVRTGSWHLWIRTALPLLLISGFLMVQNQVDVLMVGSLLGSREAGIYNAASRSAFLVSFVLAAANAVFAPTISSLYSAGSQARLQQLLHKVAHGIFWPTLAVALCLVALARPLLGIFGPEFAETGPTVLAILVVGHLVNAGAGSVGYLLSMTGRQTRSAVIYSATALINIALNAALIPSLGMKGAAIATSASMVLWNVLHYHAAVGSLSLYPSIIDAIFKRRRY